MAREGKFTIGPLKLEAIQWRHENMRVLIQNDDALAYHKNNALRAHQDRATLLAELLYLRAALQSAEPTP